jgi:hypothetical protein
MSPTNWVAPLLEASNCEFPKPGPPLIPATGQESESRGSNCSRKVGLLIYAGQFGIDLFYLRQISPIEDTLREADPGDEAPRNIVGVAKCQRFPQASLAGCGISTDANHDAARSFKTQRLP